eukprot:COSAG01_NODE_4745_length_4770_cov_28.401627_7_plen_116_part_00
MYGAILLISLAGCDTSILVSQPGIMLDTGNSPYTITGTHTNKHLTEVDQSISFVRDPNGSLAVVITYVDDVDTLTIGRAALRWLGAALLLSAVLLLLRRRLAERLERQRQSNYEC